MKLPIILQENRNKIQSINEPQFKIARPYYEYSKYPKIKNVFEECRNGIINRSIVTRFFQNGDFEIGFFAAMIWGGISVGGVTGNNLIKLIQVPESKLNVVINMCSSFIANNDFKSAYEYMDNDGKLEGLGDSFFTKLFFFVANARKQDYIPPIFDKWTKLAYAALLIESSETLIFEKYIASTQGTAINFRNRFKSIAFEDYVLRMNSWSRNCNTDVSKLETYIFGTDKRKDNTGQNTRNVFEKIVLDYELGKR